MQKKIHRHRLISLVLLLAGIFAAVAETSASEQPTAGEPLNPKALIFEHIQDAYWWHIATINGRSLSLYLPVIVYSSTEGLHVFSSARLAQGRSYKGFYLAPSGKYAGKIVVSDPSGREIRPLDLSLTRIASAIVLNSVLLLVLFLSVARWYRRRPGHPVPGGFVGLIEMLVMSIEDDIIRKSIGRDYARYSPYLLTAFFFIFVNNLMGLLPVFPGGANVTGNIAVTLVLALCTMLAVNLFGNKTYWKEIFWPDVPLWLKVPVPLMPVIELFGVLSKPFSLTIRLFANITAGHAVLLALTCLIFLTVRMGAAANTGMTVFSVLLSVFMSFLEILVAYIQAYVFTILSAVFIGLSRQEEHADGKTEKMNTKSLTN